MRWAAGHLAGLGVRNLTGVLAVVLIAVLIPAPVLRDEDRTWRLAQIIGAGR